MADEIVKKVLIEVSAKTETLKADVVSLNSTLDTLLQKQKDIIAVEGKSSAAFVENATKIRLTKEEIKNSNKELDNSIKALNSQTGTLSQNRALLISLNAELIRLGQSGELTSAKSEALGKQIKFVSDTVIKQEEALGNHSRSVGNYQKATEGLKEKLSQLAGMNGTLSDATNRATIGFKLASERITTAKAIYSEFTTAIAAQKEAVAAAQVAQEVATLAQQKATAATEAATAIGFKFTQGKATETEVQAANAAATEANAVALSTQATAQAAATTATEAGTAAMKIFRLAMISTGIGALIVAIGALISYFTSTNEGAKKLKIAMAGVSAVFQECTKIAASMGKAIWNTLTSIVSAVSHPIDSIKKLGKAVEENIINRFKAFAVIYNAILNRDFKGIINGATQLATGVTNVTGKMQNLGKSISDVGKNFANAAKEGANVAKERFALTKAEREWSTEKIKQQKEVDLLTMKIRQGTLSEKERIAGAERAKKLRAEIFNKDMEFAKKNQQLIEREQALNSKKDYQAITDAKNRVATIDATHATAIQGIENRESRLQIKSAAANKKAAEEAKKLADEEASALLDLENARLESLANQAAALMDSYSKEIADTDEHYRKLIFKAEEQAQKHPKLKAKYDAHILQLEEEKSAKLIAIRDKFAKEDQSKIDKINKEIKQIGLNAMTDLAAKELAQLDEETNDKLRQIEKEDKETNELITKQRAQVEKLKKAGKDDEAKILEESISRELEMLDKSGQLKLAFMAQQAKKEKDIQEGKSEASKIDELEATISRNDNSDSPSGQDAKIKAQAELDAILYKQQINAATKAGKDTAKIQADYDKKKAASSKDLAKVRINTENNFLDAVISLSKKNSQVYKAAFLAKKAFAIGEVITDTSNAVAGIWKANAGIPFIGVGKAIAESALAVAMGAAQIKTITSQKPGFASGGQFISDGRGAVLPGYSRKDNVNSMLRSGEGVLVSEAMRVPWARNIASALNVQFGGRDFSVPYSGPAFAAGGIFTDGGNSNRFYTQPNANNENLANTLAYQLINNFPPIIADIKDIHNQSGILMQTQNRVTL